MVAMMNRFAPQPEMTKHLNETSFINDLMISLKLRKANIEDAPVIELTSDVIAEWRDVHRSEFETCLPFWNGQFDRYESGGGHEKTVAAVDLLIDALERGLNEGDPLLYITEKTLTDVDECYPDMHRCKVPIIRYYAG
jgi:hypothetical protein